MMKQEFSTTGSQTGAHPSDLSRWREAGVAAALSVKAVKKGRQKQPKLRPEKLQAAIFAASRYSGTEAKAWLRDNVRLIRTAVEETRSLGRSLRTVPVSVNEFGVEKPRILAIADDYFALAQNTFSEDGLAAFLEGYQAVAELEMGEIWALRPALQLSLLKHLASDQSAVWPVLISSLRHLAEAAWKDLFESVNTVDRALRRDPAGAYGSMDYESQDSYRKVIAGLSKHSNRSEHEVAEAAVVLAQHAARISDGSRVMARRTHVGFYLVDNGLAHLRIWIGYRRTISDRLRDLIRGNATEFYLGGIELATFLIVVGLLSGLSTFTPILAGLLLLLLPATQAAVDFINNLTTFLVGPQPLPKLDFSKGIPADCTTIIAVPTLLLNEEQVHDLVLDLETRFLANRDPNLLFALLTDSPDSDEPVDERDALVAVCRELIERLNRRYQGDGQSPFYLFHRSRAYNPSEGRWMGWERKRGKLLDLNQFLRGGFDSFPVKVGDLSILRRVRYVITLDSDTQLPRDAAARLVGAIAHPLNRAVVDPVKKVVVEGYGILQPRIGISIHSASRSRLASIYSGQTGFDIYTRAVSDVYQDLFGEGIFTGKGIYEVDVLRTVLEHRFPENALLSHDLIEGAYARAGLVSDIELIDEYPSHFSAFSRRKHRWMRGDWQTMSWLRSAVRDHHGRRVLNPITFISRWKILDNLRRSVLEPSTLVLLLAGWFVLPGRASYWTLATLAVLFLPVYWSLLFSTLSAPVGNRTFGAWAKDTAAAFVKGNLTAALSLVFLLHQALLAVDAIARSMLRVFITKRKLLEWETAAEAEAALPRRSTVDLYLRWTPLFSAAIGAAVWALRPHVLPVAAPIVGLWFASRGISCWLDRAPRAGNRRLKNQDVQLLRSTAERTYRYFRDWSTPETNWLIPDNVREDGTAAMRLSATNLGMLLNARLAAVHLGLLPLRQFVFETRNTLDCVSQLQKYRGHLLNWYDIPTLTPLEPRFVSTVDSGNLAACLWTLKQAAIAFAAESRLKRGVTPELAAELTRIAETCDHLVNAMDFTFLYRDRKKVLSIGFDVSAGKLEPSGYDLLASESRIASFVAIAKGDIPKDAWFHLGRAHALFRGERVLLSWTGTMFEYLMPTLWMRHYPATITEQSTKAVVQIQRDIAHRKGVPWGISESACSAEAGCDYGYAAFGIPELAMKRADYDSLVISPYSTFLSLSVDPEAAIKNLRQMDEFGWTGHYGFYEAVDYTRSGATVIRSWMAHHQGMSLLAACNLLFDNPMQRYFHAEPQVLATELLLHERIPSAVMAQTDLGVLPIEQALEAAS